tara:strand:- start:331 stop:621 length:291 start_codon:yes stop_codon:yes gene_type:complete
MAYAPIGSTVVGTHPFPVQGIAAGATAMKFWVWPSTYLQSELASTTFMSDGKDMGFQPGDAVLHINVASGISMLRCLAVAATETGFTRGEMISSAS